MKYLPTVIGVTAAGHHLHAPCMPNSASAVRRHVRAERLAAVASAEHHQLGNALHAWMVKDRECERRLRQIVRGHHHAPYYAASPGESDR